MSPKACSHCGKPAACVGAYDMMPEPEPACDACCGHGCEDGHCDPICVDCGATEVEVWDDPHEARGVFLCERCGEARDAAAESPIADSHRVAAIDNRPVGR